MAATSHIRLLIALAILPLILITLPWLALSATQPSVAFIDVGQGDSALIRDETGFDVLIDGGRVSAGPTDVAYLRQQGVDDIDVLVASHADSDHIGGLIDVLEASDIPVEQVIYNGYPGDTATWYSFATAVAEEGLTLTEAHFPQEIAWGNMTAHILNPIPGLISPDQNDVSVVIRLDGPSKCLFTGDIDSTVEATVIARGTPLAADILKVSHHGSKYSSSEAFLAAVQPTYAVISVGDNPYGHPAPETIARLQTIGAEIRRTDELGTIVLSLTSTDVYTINLPIILRIGPIVAPTMTPTPNCDPCYPTVCIPPPPPDLACGDIPHRDFTVLCDPHGFDGNGDGVGCES